MTAKSGSSVFSTIVLVIVVVFAAAVCLGSLGFGLNWVYQQHERITTYTPISVEVESSRVTRGGSRRYRTYEPVIEYKFEKDGEWHRAKGLYPAYSKGRKSWAEGMVAKFPPGTTVQAYINPSNPKEAFLVPHYSSVPYSVFLVGGLVTLIIVGVGFEIKTNEKKFQTDGEPLAINTQGRSSGSGKGVEQWVVLTPRKKLAARASMWGWLTFLSFMFLLTYTHYLWYAARPYENFGFIFSGIALGTTLGLAITWIVVKRASQAYSDAMLAIDRTQLAQGDIIGATLAITPSTNISQGTLSCRLICIETQTKVSNAKKETVDVQVINHSVFEDEVDEAMAMVPILRDFSIYIPTYDPLKDAEPLENPGITSKVLPKDEPILAWTLIINIKAKSKPDYTGEFPLLIEPQDA
jgi:hypothetical protein